MRIVYLVHDLGDAAVARRVRLFADAGHRVQLWGFRRAASAPPAVAGAAVGDLGRTADGRLWARALAVLKLALVPGPLRAAVRGADVVVARNLETLVLAARLRRRGQRLVYECLDIHRLLLGTGLASRLLHAVERWALARTALVVVSAPAFRDAYFHGHIGAAVPVLLLENKVPADAVPASVALAGALAAKAPATDALPAKALPVAPPPGGAAAGARPWVIGWFGMLRCRKSLAVLARLAGQSGGRIAVLIAGKPSAAEFPDLAGEVAAMPGVTFVGAYAPADLAGLYARVDFVWAIDWFEEGLNSRWLLPNRLYEGLAHGAVPIALAQVATGQWLAARGVGLVVSGPEALGPWLAGLDAPGFARLRAGLAALPRADIVLEPAEAASALDQILGSAPAARVVASLPGLARPGLPAVMEVAP